MIRLSSIEDYLATHPNAPGDLQPATTLPTLVVERPEYSELLWTLRLCEFFGNTAATFPYQPNVSWQREAPGALSYQDRPVTSPDRQPALCSCRASAVGDTLDFELSVTNHAPQTWPDCWAWLCLIHRWARAFQANCELPAGPPDQPWVPVNALEAPLARWLKWCPIAYRQGETERIGPHQSTRWQPHIQATQGAVRAWRIEGNKQQFIRLTSPDAFLLGWSHWPCTDMGVYFGTLEPGQTGRITGRLDFYEESFEPI